MSEFSTEKEFLKTYNVHDFEVPLATVDMAIFTIQDDKLKVLLVKRADYPSKGKWALPGGFIDLKKDKELKDTAHRKLKEKTGVEISYLEQVETIGSTKRDPRGWALTVVYFALIASQDLILSNDSSSEEIAWVSVDKVKGEYKLAFDHQEILENCYERLKGKVQYTSLPVNLLSEEFTLTELQKTFEIILDKTIEKKAFRRRIIDANILEETGEMKRGSNRPAKLYRVINNGESHFFARSIEGPR